MKKFFEKQHNILFIASAVLFLQFLSAVVSLYFQAIEYDGFIVASFYIYMVYCLAACVITATVVIKNPKGKRNIDPVKIWFSGFFLYAVYEILLYAKLIITAYRDIPGFSFLGTNAEISDSVYFIWNIQPLSKLSMCAAIVFLTYCALFISEKKKLYIGFAGVNLIIAGIFMILMPSGELLALSGDEGVLGITLITIIKEAGTLIFTLNMFIFAMCKFYKYRE